MNRTATCLVVATLAAGIIVTGLSQALACACCSFVGQRNISVRKYNNQLEQFSFRSPAKLVIGERDDHPIPGMEPPVEDFMVTVANLKNRISFSFRDTKDRSGTLSLVRPQSIATFEVDPHDTVDHGQGPNLYKEWTISTAMAGDGIFHRSNGPNRRITLVLHGRGNSCTDASSFTHWTLQVHGREPAYTFYGELGSGGR